MQRVEVAVGILYRSSGELLVQERRVGTDCAGQWEFPGGKQEAGETIGEAICRELHEELAIKVQGVSELTVLTHDYPHALVRLHVFLVERWQGEVVASEGQQLAWLLPTAIRGLDLLAAAYPLLDLAEAALAERASAV